MMGNHFSIILLPTNKCNVNCEYCFEDKTSDRMTLDQLKVVMTKVLDYMDESHIAALTIHWQGGEIMTMPAQWFAEAHDLIQEAASARGKIVEHGLQSNMIAYHPRWNEIIAKMFGNSVGTSMDFPNLHRKLFNGSASDYTRIWKYNVQAAMADGIDIAVIAVPNQATLDVGAERLFSFFIDEVGVRSFQVNTPFPGGTQNDTKDAIGGLNLDQLGQFFSDLTEVWADRGYNNSIAVGPVDELVKKFTDGSGCLPCIWQANCADEFISIDARGFVAQCDCWVTSYPEYFFGNIFEDKSLTLMLRESRARKKFVDRPVEIIPRDCIECDYLSLCHGGCPVRTYTFRGTMFEKDPYCQVYLAMFRKAEQVAARLAGDRALGKPTRNSLSNGKRRQAPQSVDTFVQIERARKSASASVSSLNPSLVQLGRQRVNVVSDRSG